MGTCGCFGPKKRDNEGGIAVKSSSYGGSLAEIHLQTKKEFQRNMLTKKHSGANSFTLESIWGTTTASEDIRGVYIFDKKELGHGHFGSVRRAKIISDPKRNYAVKTIKKDALKADIHLLKRELEILRAVDHPNIAKFYECYQDEKFFHFVIEYCSGGDLVSAIIDKSHLSEAFTKKIIFQVLLAINHLHDRGICHRDIKPDNFLFSSRDKDSDIKLIDFGLSKQYVNSDLKSIVGTPYYVSPEVFKGRYDERCDYWSIGAMMYVMLSGEPPFYAKNDKAIFAKILKCKYSFKKKIWKTVSDGAKNMITRFLEPDVNKRLTARDALSDDYFQKINIDLINLGKTYLSNELIERLKLFKTSNAFQKEVIKLMVNIFDDNEEVKRLRYVFFYLDYANNGTISNLELKEFFKELGENMSDAEMEEIVDALHLRQNGLITYSEFIAATVNPSFFQDDSNLKLAFLRFDIDGSNYITPDNVKKCFARFGYNLSQMVVENMIGDFDIKHDNRISFDEFVKMMKNNGGAK